MDNSAFSTAKNIAKTAKPGKPTYRNQAAQRVLRVLDAFSGRSAPVSAPELCKTLKMTKNMVHRALTLLEAEGLVIHNEEQMYELGPRVLTFANAIAQDSEDIYDISRPYMEMLHDLTGESIFLGIIVGRNRVVIDKIEATGPRIAHSQRGLAVPLHVGKQSRVLLAFLSDAEIEAYLRTAPPLSDFSNLFVDAAHETNADVWHDIRVAREQGYIAWHNPRQWGGGTYISFAVLDGEHRPHAVISVGAPMERLSPKDLDKLLPQMLQIMSKLRMHTKLLAAPTFSLGS